MGHKLIEHFYNKYCGYCKPFDGRDLVGKVILQRILILQ